MWMGIYAAVSICNSTAWALTVVTNSLAVPISNKRPMGFTRLTANPSLTSKACALFRRRPCRITMLNTVREPLLIDASSFKRRV